jgi:hypothetical protein
MDAGALPVWAQFAGAVATALVATIVAIAKYTKTQVTTGQDPKVLRDLGIIIREHEEAFTRDIKRLIRSNEDLQKSIDNNIEAVQDNTRTNKVLVKNIKANLENGEYDDAV